MIDTAAFESELRRDGYDEILLRDWDAAQQVPEHTHPFDTRVMVLEGEFTLTCGGVQRLLRAGDVFALAADTPHSESYGPQGARFLAGRRKPASA
jgi:mannose-6-phosphate isomerase-like protein (cupin superfamily)